MNMDFKVNEVFDEVQSVFAPEKNTANEERPLLSSESSDASATLLEPITQSKVSKAITNPELSMHAWMAAICPFVDFDSTRFSQLMWVVRAEKYLPTKRRTIHFSSNSDATLEDIYSILKEKFPIYFESKYTFRVVLESKVHKNLIDLFIIVGNSNNSPVIIATGSVTLVDEVIDLLESRFKEPAILNVRELSAITEDGPIEHETEFVEGRIGKIGKDAFYPFLKCKDGKPFSITQYAKEYKESSSNILFLIGSFGTGKTSFLKALMMALGYSDNGLANGNNTTMHPGFINWLNTFRKDSLVVIEDAHDMIIKREVGNDQMSNILNYAEGITSDHNKLIISTNIQSLSNVDPALVRPGRCFDILHFRMLEGSGEINDARKAIGLTPIEVSSTTHMSLAEALNVNEAPNEDKLTKSTFKVGF